MEKFETEFYALTDGKEYYALREIIDAPADAPVRMKLFWHYPPILYVEKTARAFMDKYGSQIENLRVVKFNATI